MKKSVFSKMLVTYIAIITVTIVMIAGFLSLWFENYYFSEKRGQLLTEAQYIGEYGNGYLRQRVSAKQVSEFLDSVSHYLSSGILLVDNYGYVYATSNSNLLNRDSLIGMQVLSNDFEELRLGKYVEKRGGYINKIGVAINTLAVPIFIQNSFKGAVVFQTPIGDIREPLNQVYKIIWFSAIFAIIISCIIIYYFSQRIIINPLAEINYVADKLSKGEIQRRVKIDADDEIGELAKSFNTMADSLEHVENMRREFISNVSHEIRSPITSIKGFIGGIIDGVVPEDKQDYYLKIAYEETQRLTRLVNELLDLSAIEAGQFKLRTEELDLNELIRLCVIKFETTIKSKKIKAEVLLEEESLMVIADRDRLIQVITNLVDNAIKYVPEGGNVSISTKTKGDKVFVMVFNDGPHIVEEDIKHIWERFYKADKARSSKVSTGLGLPIVRSILTQLGEDIWVENKTPQGVTFTFSLKRI